MSKKAKHINDPRSLRIEAAFSFEVIHASMPSKLGGDQACGSCIMPGLPTHLVQELNIGTVARAAGHSKNEPLNIFSPVLQDLHWLPIRKRIEFKILLLTFKCMQGCAPLYLRELLVKQANTRTLRSNTKNLLQIPLTYLKRFGDRAFCAYAPRLWNELPDNIKAADSVQNFKKQLETLLFRKEFIWLYGPWQLSTDYL